MSSRTIAPRDFADFHAIMTLCGIQQEAKELFANANRIRNAHMRAGRQIQARLRSLVMEGDVDEIERQGSKQFELPDLKGVRLTAFRVENRSPKVTAVPSASIERVFDLEST